MMKKYLSLMFIGLLVLAPNLQSVSAQSKTDNPVEKIKANVTKRGTGEKARVKVKMLNGTEMKGYISQTEEDSFNLTDSKTKQTTTISYRDVAQVKSQGLSKGAKIAIFGGIAAIAVVAIIAYQASHALDNLRVF